ncbi:MAG: hypothetical protein U9Q72_01350 [Patescibacteria group bacterium]|nr:hypothetical protein [Patescibacteria group bacterium]
MQSKKRILKSIFTLGIIFVLGLFLFPELANGALYNPIESTTGSGLPDKMLVNLIATILDTVYKIVVGLSLIFIIIGGVMYMLASGNDEKMARAKKIVIYAVMGLAIAVGAAIFLKEIATALGINDGLFTVDGGNIENLKDVEDMFDVMTRVISLLLTSLGMLGIIGLVIGGIWYLNAGGNEDKAEIGKKTLTYSILGLVIAIGSLIIVKQIAILF